MTTLAAVYYKQRVIDYLDPIFMVAGALNKNPQTAFLHHICRELLDFKPTAKNKTKKNQHFEESTELIRFYDIDTIFNVTGGLSMFKNGLAGTCHLNQQEKVQLLLGFDDLGLSISWEV